MPTATKEKTEDLGVKTPPRVNEPPATEPEPEPAKAKTDGTEYVVLREESVQVPDGGPIVTYEGYWDVFAPKVQARSAQEAVRKSVEAVKDDNVDGVYIAVPARSWQKHSVSVKTEIKIS